MVSVLEPSRRLPGPRRRQRIASVELGLLESHAESEPALIWRVGRCEIRAEVAVALLESQRLERPVTARSDPVLGADGHQPVPHLHCPTGLDVELVAELADESDPLREHGRTR